MILGIETSCDETAAAVYSGSGAVLSNVIYSQTKEHKAFQGVVPEVAARAHLHNLSWVINEALICANCELADIAAFGATGGPGLVGGVMIGTVYAKMLSSIFKKPYIAVNHLEAHALSPKIDRDIQYPYLLLLVSGGHCQFISVNDLADYEIFGKTLDDAVGEAFDKVAKLLNLGYPGGPAVEQAALNGDPYKYKLPLSMTDRAGCDMSFSGLKTAVLYLTQKVGLCDQVIYDISASFQYVVGEILANRVQNAIKSFEHRHLELSSRNFVIAGGVAANKYLRQRLQLVAENYGFHFDAPSMNYCTDNAAMIAYAASEYLKRGIVSNLNFSPRARWSLESLKADLLSPLIPTSNFRFNRT